MYTSEKGSFQARISLHKIVFWLVESRDAQRQRSNRNVNVDVNVTLCYSNRNVTHFLHCTNIALSLFRDLFFNRTTTIWNTSANDPQPSDQSIQIHHV